jgi:hypothetical protein
VVTKAHPEFFEYRGSPEFKDWYRANQNRVEVILSDYDDLDPEGGIKLMDTFLSETGRKKEGTPQSAPAQKSVSDADRRRAAISASPSPGRSTPAKPAAVDDEERLYQEAAEWSTKRRR